MKKIFVIALLIVWSSGLRAEEQKSLAQLQEDLSKIDKSIEVTRKKMKEVRDVNFLPDLYFVLAELHVEKSRYLYTINRQKNKTTPLEELDFSDSRKAKKQAIEIYQRFTETFPKSENLDKAYFYMAHEYRELGATEDMVKTYGKLTSTFPKSSFWEESQLILGDYFLDQKKDPKFALEFYQKILARPQNPFMPLARYKSGWCYINMERFSDALLAFEGVITIDSAISLDKLPDVYKKSDIRRDALTALVWPYSEQKTLDAYRENALNYFERLSPNRPTLLKVLDKLAKRLMMKNKIEKVMPVYFRLLEITNDLERRVELIEHFYEALRKSKKSWPLDTVPEEIASTLIRARWSADITSAEKVKMEKNYEIYLRDITTRLQKKAKATRSEGDFEAAIKGYEHYLFLFPNTKYTSAMLLNQAESYYAVKKYARAGYKYEELARRTVKTGRKNIYDSAIQSFAYALKTPDKISKLELTESREGFRDIGSAFVKSYPGDKANAMIMFNIGRTYYDERDFDRAVTSFNAFLASYPNHKEATTAGNLILDSYNQREDYEGLIKAGRGLIANRRLNNRQFKADVAEIIKQAEYRKIQNVVGDSKSRDYAKKLLIFASKYQGSSLGDQALYEAFISLKAKKDPQAYEPGEQLLTKFADSKYAKEVVGALGQMALNTADYRRAARYFETFARKYPKEPTARGLLNNASNMRELMGDYREASEDYRDLGPAHTEDVAKQFALGQDWVNLGQTLAARPVNSLRGRYWMGLALYRQGHVDQARSFLTQAARARAHSYEEKKMAAHSLYLLSTQALKEYQSIQLGGGGNEAKLVKVKNDLLTKLTNQFKHVIAFGNGRWTIAALYELGRANNEFAQFVNGAAMPAGLNAGQQAQYRQLIGQQAAGFKQKANSYFSACLQNAEKYEVFTGFVRGCQSQGTQNVDEVAEEKILVKAGDSAPPDAAGIRRQLFDNPRNISLLLDLAQSYVRTQDYAMARVILSRVLEIKPRYALAEAQMGMDLLFMNDLEQAQSSFKIALQHNPREATALWGLAALYKQFGFNAKYQSTFSRARSAGRPSGTLHPWVSSLF